MPPRLCGFLACTVASTNSRAALCTRRRPAAGRYCSNFSVRNQAHSSMVDYSRWANMPSSPSSSDDDAQTTTSRSTSTSPCATITRPSSQQEQQPLNIHGSNSSADDRRHRGAVVFLHGSGDTGEGVRQWLEAASRGEFERVLGGELGLKVVFPTAPARAYSLAGGTPSTVWFDRAGLSPRSPQDRAGVLRSLRQVETAVRKLEEQERVPRSAVFVGGFSMGGCLALECLGNRDFAGRLAGVFSHASFLNDDSAVLSMDRVTSTPVYTSHGRADGMVKASWGQSTAEKLRGVIGLEGLKFTEHEGLDHELSESQIKGLLDWISAIARRPDFGRPRTPSDARKEDERRASAGDDSTQEPPCSVRYEITELGKCMSRVSFQVPEGSEGLLSGASICARGSFFQLEGEATPGCVSTSFMSPKPELAAAAIARRIEQRLVDPRPPGMDEACCLS